MKRIIDFCKSHLSELLFALVVMCATLSTVCGALCFNGITSLVIIALSVIALAFFGGKLWPANTRPSSKVKTVWYSGFAFLAFALCICVIINFYDWQKCFLYSILAIAFIWLVSAIGVVCVFDYKLTDFSDRRHSKKHKELNKKRYGKAGDVLCKTETDEVIRVPFTKRNIGTPIAIFPFENAEYLELEEYDGKRHTDEDVDVSRLLDTDFCERVAKKKDWLNHQLKYLSSPILEGEYLADSHYMMGCGWIVAFDAGKKVIRSDYYGGNERAKLRYMGWFYEKCKK